MNINKVFLAGRTVRDAEAKFTPKGTAITDITVVTNNIRKDAQGNKIDDSVYCDCTFFGRLAEVLNEHAKKGTAIFVEGRLQLDTWTDSKGEKRNKMKVIGESFQFLGGKKQEKRQNEHEEEAF